MHPEKLISPPALCGPDERLLLTEEGRDLDCQVEWRHGLARDYGADLSSETMSLSEQFGHVFRYKVWNREGPDAREGGTLVLWTLDCHDFQFATYPAPFKLPG